jgi:hypothetical protein
MSDPELYGFFNDPILLIAFSAAVPSIWVAQKKIIGGATV